MQFLAHVLLLEEELGVKTNQGDCRIHEQRYVPKLSVPFTKRTSKVAEENPKGSESTSVLLKLEYA